MKIDEEVDSSAKNQGGGWSSEGRQALPEHKRPEPSGQPEEEDEAPPPSLGRPPVSAAVAEQRASRQSNPALAQTVLAEDADASKPPPTVSDSPAAFAKTQPGNTDAPAPAAMDTIVDHLLENDKEPNLSGKFAEVLGKGRVKEEEEEGSADDDEPEEVHHGA